MKKKKNQIWKGIVRFVDRVFGLVLAAVIVFGIFGLAVEWILVKGPSESLRDSFVMTMLWTRRFDFIPHIFLTDEELADIYKDRFDVTAEGRTDVSLISIGSGEETDPNLGPQPDAYGLIDEDGDGVIIVEVKKKGFVGKMMVVKDPSRVFAGKPDVYGGYGMTLDAMCEKYDAIGGINGGAFFDEDGGGTGGFPDGLTIIDKEVFMSGHERTFVGFTEDNVLFVGDISRKTAEELHIRDGVSFGPALIINGQGVYGRYMESGINPRTAIGQRADGAVLLLVIDGRHISSIGATYEDLIRILLEYGAINASNLDGGSSSKMIYEGEALNENASVIGSRGLPTSFLVRR